MVPEAAGGRSDYDEVRKRVVRQRPSLPAVSRVFSWCPQAQSAKNDPCAQGTTMYFTVLWTRLRGPLALTASVDTRLSCCLYRRRAVSCTLRAIFPAWRHRGLMVRRSGLGWPARTPPVVGFSATFRRRCSGKTPSGWSTQAFQLLSTSASSVRGQALSRGRIPRMFSRASHEAYHPAEVLTSEA